MAYDIRKDIPTPGSANFDARMREEMMRGLGRIGNRRDRFVTLRDLEQSGIVALAPGWDQPGGGNPIGGPGSAVGQPDLTPPPTPTGFSVTPGISYITVTCDPPTYSVGHGHAESVLYGVLYTPGDPLPTFSDAVELSSFPGIVHSYSVNPSRTYRLWLKWRSRDGVLSNPAGGINGLEVTSGQNVEDLIDALTEAAENPAAPYSKYALRADMIYAVDDATGTNTGIFQIVTAPITNNGVLVPTGVYIRDLFVMNGTMTNAKIANLAVDNAKIANVSVDKLTAGSLLVGSYIQSANYVSGSMGFRINGAGTAEFNEVVVRGTVFASAGVFTGTINANAGYFNGDISGASGNFVGGVRGGAFTGYAWPSGTGTGYFLGTGGLLLGNPSTGRYFQVESAGNIYMPGLSVVNGNATFTGTLSIDNGSGTKLVIDSQQVRVYVGGVLRVQLGVGF